ncbi:MAG: hypothetical protein IJ960_06775 [Oscillospiraceae bacterium]|nr:hypothetical protein [Oscillospiraceae bacterium]
MKCPYAVNRHRVVQVSIDYDEEGVEIGSQTVEHNTAELVNCLQENCGAWRDGRCRYNAGE